MRLVAIVADHDRQGAELLAGRAADDAREDAWWWTKPADVATPEAIWAADDAEAFELEGSIEQTDAWEQ
jgi:hypothetical protein